MSINLNNLTEPELRDLNHRIVERLRMLRDLKAHVNMMDFRIGEKVAFHPEGREPVIGILTKYNRKSVTVITDAGAHWTVGPSHLRKVVDAGYQAKPESAPLSLVKG